MTTEDQVLQGDGDLEVALDPKPFLRITGTFPAREGRVSTIEMELNVDDTTPLAEEENTAGGPIGPVGSWFTDLVTGVVTAMRCPPEPKALVTLTGLGAGAFLADRMQHAEDCAGSCGQVLPTVRPATPDAAAAQAGGA